MKTLLLAGVALAVLAMPSLALAVEGGVQPLECAAASTKAAHPDWYRDGLYCGVPHPNGYQPHSDQPAPPKPTTP